MARTAVAVQDISTYPTIGGVVTLTNVDSVNNNMFPNDGRTLLVIYNPTGGALTFTISSVADGIGRTGDFTNISVPAGGFFVAGPFRKRDFDQTGTDVGNVYVQASSGLKVGALRITTF